MRFQQHPSSYVFSLVALGFAVFVGIVIPLAGGGNPGPAQANWTPPPKEIVEVKIVRPRATATTTAIVSATARPTVVPTNTATPTPSSSPTVLAPTVAATTPPVARISQGVVNLRAGAGTGFAVLAMAKAGEQFTISGRSEDGLWIQVCCVAGAPAWVSAPLAELPAAVDAFPVVR